MSGGLGPAALDDLVGTVTYTVAASGGASVAYVPGAGSVSTTAVDADGATWTLTIPDGAMERAATFRMTPLAAIDAKVPGPVRGGMLLEPAGVVFATPVTVTVSGGLGILDADDSGAVRFPVPGGQGLSSAQLDHFSPVLDYDPHEAVWASGVREVAEATGKAMSQARELLQSSIGAVASPPSIAWECRDDAGWKSAEAKIVKFVEAFEDPEVTLIRQLLKGQKMAELVGLNVDAGPTVGQLYDRLGAKVGKLMDATRGRSETILPVMRVMSRAALGQEIYGSGHQETLAKAGQWLDAAVDPVVKAIRQDHDYQQTLVVWDVGRQVELLLGKAMFEPISTKLKAALRFEAKVRLTIEATEPPTERWVIGGTIPIAYTDPGTGWFVRGDALVDYETYHHDQGVRLEAPSFLVEAAVVDVDFCGGTAKFLVDRMGGDNEVRVVPDGNRITEDYAKIAFGVFYDKYAWSDTSGQLTGYAFPVKLRNGKVTWIDESFDAKIGTDTGSFQFTVDHAPGR